MNAGVTSETVESGLIFRMAHDLKTPLAVIKLYAEMLARQGGGIELAISAHHLAVISAEADRAGRMLGNIVDLHHISAGNMLWRDERVDVARIVANCLRPFQAWARDKGIALHCEAQVDTLALRIDADRFARVVSGLLANALRFTETGEIRVGMKKCATTNGEVLVVTVSDDGPGISAQQLQDMFAVDAVTVGLAGDVGLGFARYVVERYQGHIFAESDVGRGSTFHIELPL